MTSGEMRWLQVNSGDLIAAAFSNGDGDSDAFLISLSLSLSLSPSFSPSFARTRAAHSLSTIAHEHMITIPKAICFSVMVHHMFISERLQS